MKNILLTTLGFTRDMIDVRYFHYQKQDGEKCYCTGISTAEAGTKYFLSNYHIDDIIVLGTPGTTKASDVITPMPISSFSVLGREDLNNFSEYGFYCYRTQQFLDSLDIEGNDIYESITPEEREAALAAFDLFKGKYLNGVREKDYFNYLNEEDASEEHLTELHEQLTKKQWGWLVYKLYGKADSFYKMHALNKNRDLSVRFVELDKDESGVLDYQRFDRIVADVLKESDNDVCLYLDLQGLEFSDSFTLFNLLSIVRNGRRLDIKSIIESTIRTNRLSAPILDELNRFEAHELRTGINIFVKYGKSDYLQNYLNHNPISSEQTNRLLCGMQYVEEGASLCNIPVLKYGLDVIRQLFSEFDPQDSDDMVYRILAGTLKMEYGKLLEGDKISIVELLRWAVDNQMYQQALTILESQIPADMVEQGIFYYAKTEEEIEKLMETLNVEYWNEIPKNRYMFNDIAHYFVKIYGRIQINNRQKPEIVNKDFAKLRIAELHGAEGIIPAYSNLNNDDMLYELLLSYYNIGLLRNGICHADPPVLVLAGGAELVAASNLEALKTALTRFTNMYSSALKKVKKSEEKPLIADPSSFKQYRTQHRLMPLEQIDDNTFEKSCLINYNGKSVSVVVRMLEPQDDIYVGD